MPSNMPTTVAILGPGSEIGQSVVAALSADPDFQIRLISRRATSDGVTADLDDFASLKFAFQGADILFFHLPVNLADPNAKPRAVQRGRNVAAACRASGLHRVVYATAMSPLPMMGTVARHLDARAEVETILRNTTDLEITCLLVPIPYQALIGHGRLAPKHVEGNMYRFSIPIGPTAIDWVDMEVVGEAVQQVMKCPQKFVGRTVALSGGKQTVQDICNIFHKYIPSKVFHDQVMTLDEWKASGHPGVVDQANAFEFLIRTDQQYNQKYTQGLVPHSKMLDEWVAANLDLITRSFS